MEHPPDRLNSLVFGVFAAVALLIAVVGVTGVLAFSVSARTRKFGIRLALRSQPENLLRGRNRRRKRPRRKGCRRFLCSQSNLQSGPTERPHPYIKSSLGSRLSGSDY